MNQAGGVTVHTIFWAPSGFAFQGSPGAPAPTYEGTIEKFYTDVSATSTATPARHRATARPIRALQRLHGRDPVRVGDDGERLVRRATTRSTTARASQTYSAAGQTALTRPTTSSSTPIPVRRPARTNAYGLRSAHRPRTPRRASWTAEVQNEVDKIVQATTGTAAVACRQPVVRVPAARRRRVHHAWTCAGPTISAATTRFRTSATA